MAYNSNSELSNERDRIYGVQDLINTKDRKLVGEPSYEKGSDVLTLYRRVVMSWVQRYKSLDIICFADLLTASTPGT